MRDVKDEGNNTSRNADDNSPDERASHLRELESEQRLFSTILLQQLHFLSVSVFHSSWWEVRLCPYLSIHIRHMPVSDFGSFLQ
jgi:hypothetical protein